MFVILVVECSTWDEVWSTIALITPTNTLWRHLLVTLSGVRLHYYFGDNPYVGQMQAVQASMTARSSPCGLDHTMGRMSLQNRLLQNTYKRYLDAKIIVSSSFQLSPESYLLCYSRGPTMIPCYATHPYHYCLPHIEGCNMLWVVAAARVIVRLERTLSVWSSRSWWTSSLSLHHIRAIWRSILSGTHHFFASISWNCFRALTLPSAI
jgi:hypothetical protein